MLRARFLEGLTAKQAAERFGVSYHSVRSQIRDFKKGVESGEATEFFLQPRPGPRSDRKKPAAREHITRLRARGYADTDIHKALALAGIAASVSLVDQVLREEGLTAMRKRTRT